MSAAPTGPVHVALVQRRADRDPAVKRRRTAEAIHAAADTELLEHCRTLGLQPVGASDCHVPEKVGIYATRFPDAVATMDDFLRSFRRGLCRPVAYVDGAYVDLV